MTTVHEITHRLIEEGRNARAHFQIWWTLRNLALPKYHATMNDYSHVDFFHAANSGHYVLFFLALSKIFDRDPRVAGIAELKRSLRAAGKTTTAIRLARELKPYETHVKRVMGIRNRSVVHNEHAISRRKVYQINGIAPDELRALIDAVCSSINGVAGELGLTNVVFESNRAQEATLNMLEALELGRARL